MTTIPIRLKSLDVFRGMTVILMILVNSPGNHTPYPWLEHSPWNGCRLADLVFPFFIFIVGISSVFSLSKATSLGFSINELIPTIIKRTLFLFLIGLFLNAFPYHFDVSGLRIMGVLQRIALCYFFSAYLFLTTRLQTQIILVVFLLLGYWMLLLLGSPTPYDETHNFAAFLDQRLLTPAHLQTKIFDPEGIASTIPAIATALIGNITAIFLSRTTADKQKLRGLILAGFIMLVAGWLWGIVLPINKNLWSSSYVLWTAGLALEILACCYFMIEMQGKLNYFRCFELFGLYALAIFVAHVFFLKIQMMIIIPTAQGSSQNLKLYLTQTLFPWASAPNAALLYALSYILLWFAVFKIVDYPKNRS